MAPVRCPLCGASHSACGQRTTTVGITIQEASPTMSGPLKSYNVEVNGYPTVLDLSDEDADRRGLTAADLVDAAPKKAPAKKAAAPAGTAPAKSRAARNKRVETVPDKAEEPAPVVAPAAPVDAGDQVNPDA